MRLPWHAWHEMVHSDCNTARERQPIKGRSWSNSCAGHRDQSCQAFHILALPSGCARCATASLQGGSPQDDFDRWKPKRNSGPHIIHISDHVMHQGSSGWGAMQGGSNRETHRKLSGFCSI